MRPKKKIFPKEGGRRQRRKKIAFTALFFLLAFSILAYRCLYLHLARDSRLARLARSQYRAKIEESSHRGNLYDATGEELAISVPTVSLAVRPVQIKEPRRFAEMLSSILGIPAEDLIRRLDPSRKYVWLKRHLSPRERDRIAELRLPGIDLVKGAKRYYPNRELASQLLGAVGVDGEGLSGLELFYDRYLRGEGAATVAFRDARGRTFETEETTSDGSAEPHHLYLTLRKNIQYAAERELSEACEKYQAKSCTAVVLDPSSGAVLAMASTPGFNPNAYQAYGLEAWRNLAVTDTFEPGSTFKAILAAAALESGAVRADEKFFCENGELKVGDHVLHDHERYGMLSFREIIKVSSNIGIYKVGRKVGRRPFAGVMDRFGFGRKTGVDYPGEVAGRVPPVKDWQEVDFANLTFGQGVRVTALQLASSFAAIANGGTLWRPYLLARATDTRGNTLLERRPEAVGRVLKKESAALLKEMMETVAEEGGTAVQANLPGYSVAGKTGTAQKFEKGAYSHTKFVSSFVGIVPASEPRLVGLVVVDEPKGMTYGGVVAAPVFRKIAWASLIDLGVPPDQATSPKVVEAGLWEFPLESQSTDHFPDFRGLSRRKVTTLLEKMGLRGEMVGSGVAVAQEPPPGTLRKKGEICRVFFQPD